MPEYPKFYSNQSSYATYDKVGIHDGAYKRNDFHFKLEQFVFENMDEYDVEDLAFDGTMVSDGIFPEFEEDLIVMPDQSLGFQRNTPEGGFPLYKGAGNYEGRIQLSNRGFRGNKGTYTFMTSTSTSDKITFFPDSMHAEVDNFKIEKQLSLIHI